MDQTFPDRSIKPFRTGRIPNYPVSGDQLLADTENRVQNHADILGCALFQSRNDILSTLAVLVQDEDYRAKFGKANSEPFAALAELPPESQAAAMKIAELAMNRLIEAMVGELAAGERALPGDYCVSYKLEAQLEKITGATANGVKLKKVDKCTILDANQSVLPASFNSWLQRFGKSSV
ncbi:hypothetical protein M2375_001418 [Comamonas sp. BIGb0152]|uniref:hypothetical protein n=1 Tax=Comamonas sp. BIGb0152 TaxID=2940601 RepID=UPI0021697317|nr:hypothetical protein [Comamonas sp. BIGb0152]MCS4293201.1 hypothetical protein [Comamonas sp. BIGb0152]